MLKLEVPASDHVPCRMAHQKVQHKVKANITMSGVLLS